MQNLAAIRGLTFWPAPARFLLRQVGQIHFQGSALTGLVMLLALAAVSPAAAAGAAFASAVALLTAFVARLPRAALREGLYGYNAALTGAGLLSFFAPALPVFAYLTLVSAASVLITARWLAWGRLPALTMQFVLAMWLAFALEPWLGARLAPAGCAPDWTFISCGIGQVTFIGGTLPGLAVWLAFTWHHRAQGLWLGLGAALAWLATLLLDTILPGLHAGNQMIGLAVNAALVAQGLTVFGHSPKQRLVGVLLCVPLCLGLGLAAIPYFTLPFNLVTWALIAWTRPGK